MCGCVSGRSKSCPVRSWGGGDGVVAVLQREAVVVVIGGAVADVVDFRCGRSVFIDRLGQLLGEGAVFVAGGEGGSILIAGAAPGVVRS